VGVGKWIRREERVVGNGQPNKNAGYYCSNAVRLKMCSLGSILFTNALNIYTSRE